MAVVKRLKAESGEAMRMEGDSSVSVPDGSSADIFLSGGGRADIRIGKNCRVRCFMLQEKKAKTEQSVGVGAGSSLEWCTLWLSGGSQRFSGNLSGEGAKARAVHVFVGRGKEELGIDAEFTHSARNTKADMLVKGVVSDGAAARLGGMIRIGKDGAGAESFLAEHAMLLGARSRATAKPELEISNNDVSSRHSASVSRVDEGKLFYLMSRGLPGADAAALMVSGFLDSALARVPDAKVRAEWEGRVSKAL